MIMCPILNNIHYKITLCPLKNSSHFFFKFWVHLKILQHGMICIYVKQSEYLDMMIITTIIGMETVKIFILIWNYFELWSMIVQLY